MKKLIVMALTILSFLGCSSAQYRELVSVRYHRSGMHIDDRTNIRVKKTAEETYTVEFEEGRSEESNYISFEITQSQFDSLANIVFQMDRPGRERRGYVLDLTQYFDVEYIKNGKETSRRYSINQRMNKKTSELQNKAIMFMAQLVGKYRQRSEIRISYSKGIATPTDIYTHAEPADLVEYLGDFVEDRNQGKDECGGSLSGTYRWKALKPGVVTVWFEELDMGYDEGRLTEEFEPYGCYIIDENLTVSYSKEETEAAKERFSRAKSIDEIY